MSLNLLMQHLALQFILKITNEVRKHYEMLDESKESSHLIDKFEQRESGYIFNSI